MDLKALAQYRLNKLAQQKSCIVALPKACNRATSPASYAIPHATTMQPSSAQALPVAKSDATPYATRPQQQAENDATFHPKNTPQSCIALEVLQQMTNQYQANLRAGGYSEAGARVWSCDWQEACRRQGIHESVLENLRQSGGVIINHGYVHPARPIQENK